MNAMDRLAEALREWHNSGAVKPLAAAAERVLVYTTTRERYSSRNADDILEMRDVRNGKVVLSVGTDHDDSYYPSFVAEWTPENLAK